MGSAACMEHVTAPAMPVSVTLHAFRQSMLDCDIYIRTGSDGKLKLYRKKGQRLDGSDLDRLEERGIRQFLVSRSDQEEHRRCRAPEICQDTSVAPSERYKLLREVSRASFEAAYQSGDTNQVVELVQELGPQLTDILSDSDLVLADLYSLMDHDHHTYSHSINVSAFTVLLAKYLGTEDQQDLSQIATGGLLHDLGKRHIELQVLNKRGALEDHERRTMSEHPRLGFQDVLPRGDLSWKQLMMVYQHHEQYDGGGYPVGLPAREIHDLARVTTIVDVFHAITSVRPYRKPMRTNEACNFLWDHSGKLFDPEMVQCWISKMKSVANG